MAPPDEARPDRDHEREPGDAPLLDVDPLAIELGERFRAAGFELAIVGGSVRDVLIGRPPTHELDFATDAKPDQTLRVIQGWAGRRYLQGVRFGTVGATKDGTRIDRKSVV